jgi:O-antigen ligase
MSTLSRDLSRPMMALTGLVYVALLAIALISWHLPPELVLALTIGAAGLMVMTLRPFVGIHAFMMVMYLAEPIATESGITGMKVVGSVILAGWLFGAAARRRLNIPFNGMMAGMVLFVGWCWVCVMYAIDVPGALTRTLSFVQLCLSALMFSSIVDDVKRIRSVLGAIVLWTVVTSIVGIAFYYRGETNVAIGLVGNRNLLASYVIGAVPCAYLLHRITRNALARLLMMISLPILFLTLALTLSRTGIIVMVATLLIIWYRVALERGVLVVGASLVVLLALGFILPDAFYKRLQTIAPSIEQERDTYGLRVRLWQVGLKMIEDRPITGVGPANFMQAHRRYAHGEEILEKELVAHNMYVGIAAEEGLVGLFLFGLTIVLGLRELHRARRVGERTGAREVALIAVAIEANLFMVLGVGLMGNLETMKYFWVFLGLTLSLGRVARRLEEGSSDGSSGRREPAGGA